MEFNKFQSTLEELRIDTYPQEVQNEFFEAINGIPYISSLIRADRPYVQDLPKDENGRAIIDLSDPPIVENVDYFRPTALHYQQYGCLTSLRPNANPNSEFGKWFYTELDRIWNGMTRPDGAWITGDMYFYLNYCPIVQSRIRKGSKVADRIVTLPEFWEGIDWRFKGIEKARNEGHHFAEIAKRGASKSYSVAAILAKLFTVGENKDTCQKIKALVMAYQKEYLTKDGTLNKFVDIKDFLTEQTQFPSKMLKRSLQEMQWKMGYIDVDTGIEKGTQNEVIGISAKDDPDKVRGKRASRIIVEEFGNFPKIVDTYRVMLPSVQEGDIVFGTMILIGCVCAGTQVYTKSGKLVNIENLKQSDGILGFDIKNDCVSREDITYIQDVAYKECVRISTKHRSLECSIDHPILTRITHSKRLVDYKVGDAREHYYEYKFVPAGELSGTNYQAIVIADDVIKVFGSETLTDAYLIGLLIGDGSYGYDKTPRLFNCDDAILSYIEDKYDTVTERTHITKEGKLYKELRIKGICQQLRQCGIYGQTKTAKRLPVNWNNLTMKESALLLAGLFDTDGTISKDSNYISICSSCEKLLDQIKQLLYKFGIKSNVYRIKADIKPNRKDKNDWFNLTIISRNNILKFSKYIPIKVEHKKKNLAYLCEKAKSAYHFTDNTLVEKITKVERIGVKRVYNLTANNTHTYIANGIITHNTGGSEGADFAGAQEIIYSPLGYNILPFKNVYDKGSQGKGTSIFFFGAPVNRKGCYNHDGISDVTKAVLEICNNRYLVKYNSTDPMALTRTKAENPLTLQEAIMRRDSTMFPVASLLDRINQLQEDESVQNSHYTGNLVMESNGMVKFVPTADQPIRYFPHKDNKNCKGAVEIIKMPEVGVDGKVFSNRYLAGADPYDDDTSETVSLGSIFILDLWTDSIVAEYTGRPTFADEYFEICRLLLLFYNARLNYENNKKGLFAYFSRMNCLYLLTDTLEFLKDKDMVKGGQIGNKLKGTQATEGVNNYARTLIRNWLIKERTKVIYEDGEERTVTVYNLFNVENLALLMELSQWNPDGNFDRVSAMGMLMLLREDRLITYNGDLQGSKKSYRRDYNDEDSFFTKNYNGGMEPEDNVEI